MGPFLQRTLIKYFQLGYVYDIDVVNTTPHSKDTHIFFDMVDTPSTLSEWLAKARLLR